MEKWLEKIFFRNTTLHYRLNIIFAFFFLCPVLSFLYFGFKYEILADKYIPFFFLGILIFYFLGMVILRRFFDDVSDISHQISQTVESRFPDMPHRRNTDELHSLIHSFGSLEKQLYGTFQRLEKKSADISILKELSDLCYMTFDADELLYITLERALLLSHSEIGSVMTIEQADRKYFVVRANIGLGEHIRIGEHIDFETSIAKYAVVNKTPLVVGDIEKDSRFGRANRSHYGTKAFVCMPIRTSRDIVGVISISRKGSDMPYTTEDVDALIPLVSNAAFAYENLHLVRANEQNRLFLRAVEKIFRIINSTFRGSELLRAVLNEIQNLVPFDTAIILDVDRERPGMIRVVDIVGSGPESVDRGTVYEYGGTVFEKVLTRKNNLIISDMTTLIAPTDLTLLATPGCRACLLTPVRTEGDIRGVMAMTAPDADVFYQIQHFIEWIVSSVSLAMERNSLTSAVSRRDQELDSIRQIGRALASSTFDIEKVLDYTMDMIRVLINTQAGTLFLTDGDELESSATFNIDNVNLKRVENTFRLKIGQGIAGYVAARGEAIIVNDTAKSPHFYSDVDKATGFKTHSILCVPMISQGRVIGIIEVMNKINGDFTTNDQHLLQSIAASVSIAVENARLYKETVAMAEHERGIRGIFQKFVPREILDQIIHGSESGKTVINELKVMTLLNIDIRNSSGFVKKIGPQKTVSLLNRFFSLMGEIVFKHHGIVDKYLGDGFLALFGAPVSSALDAENAITAALEMQASVSQIDEYSLKEFGEPFAIGISIHTGEVVVGNIGFDMKMDYTVIGDPVNTVFRLQELTKPVRNSIVVSENVCRSVLCRLKVRDMEQDYQGIRIFELMGKEDENI